MKKNTPRVFIIHYDWSKRSCLHHSLLLRNDTSLLYARIQGTKAVINMSSTSSLMLCYDITKKLQMAPGHFSVCWLVLVCVIPGVMSCLQCDLAVCHMHEDFISTKHNMTVQEQMDLKKIVSHAYVTYQDTSMQLSGVIGVYDYVLKKPFQSLNFYFYDFRC